MGLSFDAWLYHPQLADLTALARAFPQQPIVLDHVGGPLGLGWYADKRQEVLDAWRRDIRELATCANVSVKLGGLGMLYALAIGLAFVKPGLACGIYVLVAVMWLVPDRRIERNLTR